MLAIFNVLEQLSAIDLETKRDALLPIFVELAVRLEIRCEIGASEILCEINDLFNHLLEQRADDDVADELNRLLSQCLLS